MPFRRRPKNGPGHKSAENPYSNGSSGNVSSLIGSSARAKRNSTSSSGQSKVFLYGFLLVCASFAAFFTYQTNKYHKSSVTPFPGEVLPQNWTSPFVNPATFWGSYRPGVYFGVKSRSTQSPVFGVAWLVQYDPSRPEMRHNCDQNNKLPRYGWVLHDGVNFGVHEILEKDFSLNISFAKLPLAGSHGGDWSVSYSLGKRSPADSNDITVSLFLYMALDGHGTLETVFDKERLVSIRGYTHDLSYFDVNFPHYPELKYHYLEAFTPSLHLIKEAMQHYSFSIRAKKEKKPFVALSGSNMLQIREKSGNNDLQMNLVALQVSGVLPFTYECSFESASFYNRREPFNGKVFQRALKTYSETFHELFENTFNLQMKGFSSDEIQFAEAVFSNLLGGMGYFFGASAVQTEHHNEPLAYWYTPLYTAVPSRSFFPRGFLWDEGFHQLVVSRWNASISIDAIGHWLNLMNIEGWIPREQILGSEALSRVPKEFIVQHTSNANPPALLLTIDYLLRKEKLDLPFVKAIYPRVKQWLSWYNNTQFGEQPFTFRWRGRNASSIHEMNPKSLTSGLDDYPRASHPTKEEYHLDLFCWMAFGSQVLQKLAKKIGSDDDYSAWIDRLTDFELLNKLHWSDDLKAYADYGLNTKHVSLARPRKRHPEEPDRQKERVVTGKPNYEFVDHIGYITLFPLMFGLIKPDSPQLLSTLTLIEDPSVLWSNYGLRSLSKSDSQYMKWNTEHDPPYWRGQVWLNMNFLTLKALHEYSNLPGPYASKAKDIYTKLRSNIIANVYRQYRSTGYVWEQYKDDTGAGHGSHPFTGWTSLVILIMSEDY